MNRKGLGILEVVVALGILGVMMAGMMTMMNTQTRESKHLAEKLAALDVQQVVTAALRDGRVCAYLMNNPAVKTFNTTALPQTITLTGTDQKILASANETSPGVWTLGPTVAEVLPAAQRLPDKSASSVSNNLFFTAIALKILTGSGGSYVGEWELTIDSTKLVRALKPITVKTTIYANEAAPYSTANAQILDCQAGTGGAPDGPIGSHCGMAVSYWDGNWYGHLLRLDGNAPMVGEGATCKGLMPPNCPPGYVSAVYCFQANRTQGNCLGYSTCIRQ